MIKQSNSRSAIDVLAIGNAIIDIIAFVEEEFIIRHNLIKGTMRLIDEGMTTQLFAHMHDAKMFSGGSAGNSAVGIASFGGVAAYCGKLKADYLGAAYRRDLYEQSIIFETEDLQEGPATAQCLVLVTPDGERTMNTYLGACAELSVADIVPETVQSAQITYMEGYLWDQPKAKAAFKAAAELAHEAQRLTALSLSDPFCVERHGESFLALIKSDIDIVFANEAEIMALYQSNSFSDCVHHIARDCPMAVLTRGAQGCVIVKGHHSYHVPAFPVPNVVDVTGAGDLFAAGFLYGLTQGKELEACAKLGALAAGEIISHIGARPLVNLREFAREHSLL